MRTVKTKTISGQINADGSIKSGSGFTARKTGTGLYIISFNNKRLIGASACPGGTAGVVTSTLDSFTANEFRAICLNSSFIGADGIVAFTATVVA